MQAIRSQAFRWLGVLGLVVLTVWLVRHHRRGAEEVREHRPDHHPSHAPESARPSQAKTSSREVQDNTEPALSRRISADAGFFAGDAPAADRQARFDALRAHLLRADSAAASAAIRAYLSSGNDVVTGLAFRVGGEGALDSAPSMRVFLLDLLGSIDPPAALDLSRRVLESGNSADEYAIALRNLAWNDSGGELTGELRQGFSAMLAREDWRAEAADGFLEALDAGVLLRDEDSFSRLLDLNRSALDSGGAALSRACFIALDRIVEADPGMLEMFRRDPGLRDRLTPDQRASLLSRLDIRRAAHQAILTEYLASAQDSGELDYFAAIFPNGNRFHVNRLFSPPNPVMSIADRMEADRVVLGELGRIPLAVGSPGEKAVKVIRERLGESLERADAGK